MSKQFDMFCRHQLCGYAGYGVSMAAFWIRERDMGSDGTKYAMRVACLFLLVTSVVTAAQATAAFDPTEFAQRREGLLAKLGDANAMIRHIS